MSTRRRSGMTLIELVVTLVITGLLTTAGTVAFTSIIEHRATINRANVQTERAAALRDMIRTWITAGTIQVQRGGNAAAGGRGSAVTVRTNPNAPAGVTAAVATGDELTFTTNAQTPANAPSTRVRLFVDGDQNTPEEGLTIEFQASTNTPLQRKQIDPFIGSMLVEFLDTRTRQWFGATQAATITPMAVRITFYSYDDNNPAYALPPLMQVPFVFRIGNPQAQTGGAR